MGRIVAIGLCAFVGVEGSLLIGFVFTPIIGIIGVILALIGVILLMPHEEF